MYTDGGGYTMYTVVGGIRTSRVSDLDSCQQNGLQMVIPRTAAHFAAMIALFGKQYFKAVPGIYGLVKGVSYTQLAMSSAGTRQASSKLGADGMPLHVQPTKVDSDWRAADGGDWFLRSTPFSQPSGDYTPGCWLGMSGWDKGHYRFDDHGCDFSTDRYICSTNDKGGVGIEPVPATKQTKIPGMHGAIQGKYDLVFHATNPSGNSECAALRRIIIVNKK
jgi:hypothetical protein